MISTPFDGDSTNSIESSTLGFRSGIFRKRETLLRGERERDDGAKGIYLLAALRGAPNPRRFLSLFPFLLKCQRGKERKRKKEERRRKRESESLAQNMKIHTVARRKYPSFKMDGFRWI